MERLTLSRTYINFGEKIQQKVDNLSHRHGHAHINVVLTQAMIEKIDAAHSSKGKRSKSKELFAPLVGLIEYMNNSLTSKLIEQNRLLTRSIRKLKEEMGAIKLAHEQLRQSMFGPVFAAEETDDYMPGMNDRIVMPYSPLGTDERKHFG
jgi:hypothetical protein